jgi:hypothetical protein
LLRQIAAVVQNLIDEINHDFSAELSTKQELMNDTQQRLTVGTRELAQVRRKTHLLRVQAHKLSDLQLRIKNLEACLREEMALSSGDGAGEGVNGAEGADNMEGSEIREEAMDTDGVGSNSKEQSTQQMKVDGADTHTSEAGAAADSDTSTHYDHSVPFPTQLSEQDLQAQIYTLRSQLLTYMDSEHSLQQRLTALQSLTRDRTQLCKKLVAACCKVSLEEVEGLLEPLLEAVESDGEELDMARVASVMAALSNNRAAVRCAE